MFDGWKTECQWVLGIGNQASLIEVVSWSLSEVKINTGQNPDKIEVNKIIFDFINLNFISGFKPPHKK
jgi:hypothetical protein